MLTDDQLGKIETVVEAFRLDHGIPEDTRPDMMDLLIRMRIKGTLVAVDVSDEPTGYAGEYDPSRNTITIRKAVADRQSPRDRFTIAHEIGHKLGDHSSTRYRRADGAKQFGRQKEQDEEEANAFAAALLIPEKLADVDPSTTATQLADRFAVSLRVAEIRLKFLQRRYRHKHGVRREVPVTAKAVSSPDDMFDSGDYDAAMSQMLRNARRWNE